MDVRLKNFRCVKDTGLLKIRKITLLIGENNLGKTSFMAGLNQIFGLLTDNQEISLNSAPFELGSFNDICHSNPLKKLINTYNFECHTESHSYKWFFENDGADE